MAFFNKKNKFDSKTNSMNLEDSAEQIPVATAPAEVEDDSEVLSVIAAAVYIYSEQSGSVYSVKSIVPSKQRSTRSVWAMSGILENARPF